MTSLLSGIHAWLLAHHKGASERDIEDFCCIQAVLWSCPTLRGLCWWCPCCFYPSVSYFLNSKYFSLLYISRSVPELEQFTCKLWERENVFHDKNSLFQLIQWHSLQMPTERKWSPLFIFSYSTPLLTFLPWDLLSPTQLTDYSPHMLHCCVSQMEINIMPLNYQLHQNY